MFKRILLLPIAALFCLSANAQFQYTFKDTTTAYAPLTGATSLNGSLIWDEEDLTTPLPFTWKLDNNINVDTFNLALSFTGVVDNLNNYADISGFMFGVADIADRGTLTGLSSLSPIRYVTTGTSPNRIFKAELANAGFWNEFDNYGTMNDSMNIQIWIYETKNIFELHYGPSQITNPGDYYLFGSPLVTNLKHIDFLNNSAGKLYYLKGSPSAPTVDTEDFATMTVPPTGINSWPANGTVYRFTPKPSCAAPTAAFSEGLTTGKTVQYTYSGTTTGIDSLVWNFGDGQKLKVMSSFATPVSHTFTTNGGYTVTVTVYNSCGTNTATKRTALTVGNLAGLGDVKVYPNPAANFIRVDGMQAGDKATVLSIVGQEILSTTISSAKQTIDIASLPAGSYMLMLTNTKGVSGLVKFVKQ